MKQLRFIALAACAALSLAACATAVPTSPGAPPGPIVSGSQTTLDEKALIGAEQAYGIAGNLYLAVIKAKPDWSGKADAKSKLDTAYKALKLARQAYQAGNADTFVQQVARVTVLVDQVRSILPAPE